MAKSSEELAHLEWLGYVQPVGLVVSIPALLSAQAHVNRNTLPLHRQFVDCLPRDADGEPRPELPDFSQFAQTVLGWRAADLEPLVPGQPKYASAEAVLPSYEETLRPTYVVRDPDATGDGAAPWMMLVKVLPTGTALDHLDPHDESRWHATPQFKFERLLRETQMPIGLLVNGRQIRLVYAPRGESSGYLTFNVAEMSQVAGRPILAALHLLLCDERLFSLERKQRLPAILADSRKYQNVVSTELAKQVLEALYELVRGFQAADDQSHGELLRDVLARDPNHVYAGLLTVLMRLVFVLYAEDRGLLSSDSVYANFYAVTGLFNRLRADAGRYPDTMDQRFGAWSQLLTLFRLIYDGGSHGGLRIPARRGYLFDPTQYHFLEGIAIASASVPDAAPSVPRVSDGVVHRVLSKLLVLDGERLSYRALDVEQIGSVYETMMGFNLEVARGRSIAIKPKTKKGVGAPVAINLDELLAEAQENRAKRLREWSDQEVTGDAAKSLKDAVTIDQLLAALEKKIAHEATPGVVPVGGMMLQPSDERRRTGSHYTPRSLTEPIVRTTLRPILEQLGPHPTPEQILALKICDPAMGSGAFLVEVCRQLAEELIKAWHLHRCVPFLPPDEDELLHARRMIAQRCLYGVDRNPMAVHLAKLSLWLATLAKEHPFTFLDHALKHGDSLVGLTKRQIIQFIWESTAEQHAVESTSRKPKRAKSTTLDLFADPIERAVRSVTGFRKRILDSRDDVSYEFLQQQLDFADEQLSKARLVGDLVVAAFFSASKDAARKNRLNELSQLLTHYLGPDGKITDRAPLNAVLTSLKTGPHPVEPFHWHIEFPEVFDRDNSGFDAIVGNPPFLGGTRISEVAGMRYFQWLVSQYPPCEHHCDLVAYFFRRIFNNLCSTGCLGLVATNTISQGDTREGGLRTIIMQSGEIYEAWRRYRWPGMAAVIVSVVHISKRAIRHLKRLDGKPVSRISAYLFDSKVDDSPARLTCNPYFSIGSKIYGQGFLFDDTDPICSPTTQRDDLIARYPTWKQRLPPYIGGEEINTDPEQRYHRYAIYLSDLQEEHELDSFPELRSIVESKVLPERQRLGDNPNNVPLKRRWWAYQAHRPELYARLRSMRRVLVSSQVSAQFAFAMLPTTWMFAHTANLFCIGDFSGFATIQSRVHEVWARFLASSMKDDMRYTPSDCFETFPFPAGVLEHAVGDSPTTDNGPLTTLETAGREYYEFRAALMIRNNEGLTKTYNRFHDPDERSADIAKLRDLHAAMDRVVLEAYGWHDLAQTATCKFLLDYEDDEDDEEESSGRRRKKPWRYRWPDDFRDEVLARLLALNQHRAEEERIRGNTAEPETPKPKNVASKPPAKRRSEGQRELPGM